MARKKKTVENEDYGPDMVKFKCSGCEAEGYDMSMYFYGIPQTKCLWCQKCPKKKKAPRETA